MKALLKKMTDFVVAEEQPGVPNSVESQGDGSN